MDAGACSDGAAVAETPSGGQFWEDGTAPLLQILLVVDEARQASVDVTTTVSPYSRAALQVWLDG